MFTSRILRNVGTAGNRLMNENPKDKTFLYGAGALAAVTGLVYWAGYKAEGHGHDFDLSKAGTSPTSRTHSA